METLKAIGFAALGLLMIATLIVIAAFVFEGYIWASGKIYPWLVLLNGVALAATVFVLLPNAIFSSTPRFAGSGLLIASYIFGATLWVWSLLVTYTLWGGLGLFIGLMMAGVGVVPMAALATLFNGLWSTLGELIVGVVLTFGSRLGGAYLLVRAERNAAT